MSLEDGTPVVLFPLFNDKSGKLHRFVLLDLVSPVPTHEPDRDDVYMKVD
jgi:hypothetical protein